MDFPKFKVVCEKCGGSDILKITPDRTVFYTDHTPIISARFRPDGQWGFECLCGQDSRVAPEEKDQLDVLVKNGSAKSIRDIAKALIPNNHLKFEMKQL